MSQIPNKTNEEEVAKEDIYKHKTLYKIGCCLLIAGFIGVFYAGFSKPVNSEIGFWVLTSSLLIMLLGYAVVNIGWFLDGAWGVAIGVFAAFPLTLLLGAGIYFKEIYDISNIQLAALLGGAAGAFGASAWAFRVNILFGIITLASAFMAIAKLTITIFS